MKINQIYFFTLTGSGSIRRAVYEHAIHTLQAVVRIAGCAVFGAGCGVETVAMKPKCIEIQCKQGFLYITMTK